MADNKYVTLIHSQGETLCDYSLKELETAHPQRLMRIHRNTLVNTTYLSALLKPGNSGHKARLSDPNQTLLSVSRRHSPKSANGSIRKATRNPKKQAGARFPGSSFAMDGESAASRDGFIAIPGKRAPACFPIPRTDGTQTRKTKPNKPVP